MSPRARILLVEDNTLTRKLLRVTLESEGYVVVEAADGRSAIAAAHDAAPDLVLQDLILPDIGGLELVDHLHAVPGMDEVPIVALTGFLGTAAEARARHAGFSGLLVKPVEPSTLLEEVRSHLPARGGAAAPAAAGRHLLLVDDDPIQLKLQRVFFAQLGFDVTTCSDATEALVATRARVPAAIVADVLMPGMDGFQLCVAIRTDDALCAVPVVLTSAAYYGANDHELARQVGASALVPRDPDLTLLADTVARAIDQGAPAPSDLPIEDIRLEHAWAVIRQLERQLAVSSGLARRTTLQASQIAVLSGVATALARRADPDLAVRDVLAATLDAAGISKGALFLQQDRGTIALRHSIGFSADNLSELRDFFGQMPFLVQTIARSAPVAIPNGALGPEDTRAVLARANVAQLQIVPLLSEDRGVGAIVLGASRTDLTSEDAIAFARAMGNQLIQSLDLAAAFARLAASEQRYRTLMEHANDAICVLSADGVIRETNRRQEEMLGMSREEIVGRAIASFAPVKQEHAAGPHTDIHEPAARGRAAPVPLQKADGSQVLVEFSNTAVTIDGEPLVFAIGRDVTERVRSQAQLMTSDRMASLGMLAAGLAHEINNPLAAVLANLDFAIGSLEQAGMLLDASAAAEPLEALADAREAAQAVRTIVRDLKLFSRAEEDDRAVIDIERVLDSSLRMAWNEIRHRAQLVKAYGDPPLVLANESRLGQVFLNLAINAAQAIPEGNADSNEIRVSTGVDASGRAVVEVSDTGSGMPPEILSRLFTPFFTTKPKGLGTGLGLSICERIVTALGGEILVESEVDRGTRFRVLLPPAQVSPSPKTPSVIPKEVGGPRGRVLVVDDDPSVRAVLGRALASEHDVVLEVSGRAALDRLEAGETFDVILCDLMMPVMTGVELHGEITTRFPEHAPRIVFVTGGAFTPTARAFLDAAPNEHIEKPFAIADIRKLVRRRMVA